MACHGGRQATNNKAWHRQWQGRGQEGTQKKNKAGWVHMGRGRRRSRKAQCSQAKEEGCSSGAGGQAKQAQGRLGMPDTTHRHKGKAQGNQIQVRSQAGIQAQQEWQGHREWAQGCKGRAGNKVQGQRCKIAGHNAQ